MWESELNTLCYMVLNSAEALPPTVHVPLSREDARDLVLDMMIDQWTECGAPFKQKDRLWMDQNVDDVLKHVVFTSEAPQAAPCSGTASSSHG